MRKHLNFGTGSRPGEGRNESAQPREVCSDEESGGQQTSASEDRFASKQNPRIHAIFKAGGTLQFLPCQIIRRVPVVSRSNAVDPLEQAREIARIVVAKKKRGFLDAYAKCVAWATPECARPRAQQRGTCRTLGLSVGLTPADVAAAEDVRTPALSFIPPSSQ